MQTIRDVLIKIGIESNTRGFRAPDFRKTEQEAKAATAAVQGLAQAVSQVGGVPAYGGSGPGGGGAGARTRGATKPGWTPGNATGTFGPFQQLGQPATNVIFQRDEMVLTRDASRLKYQQDLARSTEVLEKRNRSLMEVENQRAESLNGLAMGALKLVRGMAFLGAANTEEYQRMLQYIAAAQGGFDLFTGMLDVYKSLVNWKKAAAAATAVETAAEIALAGARGTSAVAGAAGSAAQGAAGGIAGGVAGRGLAAAGLLGSGAAGVALRVGGPIALAYGAGKITQWGIREGFGVHSMQRDDERLAARMQTRADASADIVEGSQRGIDLRFRDRFERPYEDAAASRSRLLKRRKLSFEDARSQILAEGQSRDALFTQMRLGKQKGDARTAGYESAKEDVTQADLRLKSQQELLDTYEKEEESLRRQWDTAQGLLRTTQETLQAEKDRYISGQERFGRLNPAEQGRALAASRDYKAGKRDRATIDILERSGVDVTGDVGRGFYLQQGEKGGFGEAASNVGGDAGLRQAQQAARHAADVARETNNEVVSAIRETTAGRERVDGEIIALMRKQREAQDRMEAAIRQLQVIDRENKAGEVKASGGWGFGLF